MSRRMFSHHNPPGPPRHHQAEARGVVGLIRREGSSMSRLVAAVLMLGLALDVVVSAADASIARSSGARGADAAASSFLPAGAEVLRTRLRTGDVVTTCDGDEG